MKGDERIGRLGVVSVTEPTADGHDAMRDGFLAEKPARDIDFVDALVADISRAVVPEPVPIVMEPGAARRAHRRGTAPQIIIDSGGNRLRAVGFADARP